MNCVIQTAGKIIFETGGIGKLPDLVAHFGSKAFLVLGGKSFRQSETCKTLLSQLKEKGVAVTLSNPVKGEPSPADVDENAALARQAGCQVVVAVGGGSVMDTGKAVSAMVTNAGSVRDYLEGIGDKTLKNDPIFLITVPTTAGTGSEVTKNAVITSLEEGFKKSIRHEKMFADVALIDPELTRSVPKTVTAASGMDTVCQLIEGYTTRQPNPFSDALALTQTPIALTALKRAYDCPDDIVAREQMAFAALCSGMIIACAGLGAAHGIAAGLGAMYGISHGIACAIMLPHVMEWNAAHGVTRYQDLARAAGTDVAGLIQMVRDLNTALHIPEDLKSYAIPQKDLERLAKACMGNSLRRNPVDVTYDDLIAILEKLI